MEGYQPVPTLPLFDQPRPWIVLSDWNKKQNLIRRTFYNLSEKTSTNTVIPDLADKFVVDGGYGNGWMFLQANDSTRSLSLFNVVTMEKVQLPALPIPSHVFHLIFYVSSNRVDPDFRVIIYDRLNLTTLHFKPGDMNFTQHKARDLPGMLRGSRAVLDGKMYGVLLPNVTLVVCDDINDVPFRFSIVGMLEDEEMLDWGSSYLVESCGDILLVQKNSFGCPSIQTLKFRVYRADFGTMTWERLENIGQRALFYQDYQCFSCSTADLGGIKSNCIYTLFPSDRSVYVYDIETNRYLSCFLPCPKVHSSRFEPKWMMLPGAKTI